MQKKKEHKQYSMVLGRYQCNPPHIGHLSLIQTLLDEGKNVIIVLREEDGTEKNPYTVKQRKKAFRKIYRKEIRLGRVKIVGFVDVIEIAYGRKVGYNIRQIKLDKKIEKVSATKIRSKTWEK